MSRTALNRFWQSLSVLLIVAPLLALFWRPTPTHAQDIGIEPAISVLITFNYDGVAGPEGEDPNFWDELVVPAFLVEQGGGIAKTTFTKVNVGDSGTGRRGVNNLNNTSVMRFEDVATGTYRACIPLDPTLTFESFECTADFFYEEGSNLVSGAGGAVDSIVLSATQTFDFISSGRIFGINESPCPGSQIGWLICPAAEEIFSTVQAIFGFFLNLVSLDIDPLNENAADNTAANAIFNIWNTFRIIASVLFFALFLIAIFGQGLAGFQIFSAYDFKKILPRLVIAAIGIQISWYVVGFMIDVFNVLGGGVRGLILAPVEGIEAVNFATSDIGSASTVLLSSAALLGAYFAVGGAIGVLFLLPIFLLNIMLAIIFGIFILLLRNALILLGVIISPVAIALWALPNTEGLFQFWWNSMWRLLVMYPLIVALVGFGELMSKLVVAGNGGSLLWSLIGLIVLFVPFFVIPYTFRVAQNIIGSVTTGLDGRRQLISDRVFGSPEDEGSWRGRQRTQRFTYGTQRRFRSYSKHYIAPGKQGRPGIKRGRLLGVPIFRPGLVQKKNANDLRTSWRKGYETNTGISGGIKNTAYFGADEERGRESESWGQYARSLPRFALRMPGRAWARANSVYAGATGLAGIDDVMGQKNRAARERVTRAGEFGMGEEEAHAMFGEFNLFTGKRLSAQAILTAKRFRKNDSEVQERMKLLFNKAAGNPYRRQALIDTWKGQINGNLPPGSPLYSEESLERFVVGMEKGVAFGTQGLYRDTKHRKLNEPKRSPTASEDRFLRTLDQIPPEDRSGQNLLVGMGQVTDGNIPGMLGELGNNLRDRQLSAFSGTTALAVMEAAQRLEDILRMESGEIDTASLVRDIKTLKDGKGDAALAADVQRRLSEFSQPRQVRDDENRFVFDDKGNQVLTFDEKKDVRQGGLSDPLVLTSIQNLASLRASYLDTIAQGDTGVDEGDDDSVDAGKPQLSSEQRFNKWRREDIAEYEWVEEEKSARRAALEASRAAAGDPTPISVSEITPSTDEIQEWKSRDDGRNRYMEDNADRIYQLQIQRENLIIKNASTAQLAGVSRDMVTMMIEASRWVNNPEFMQRMHASTGLIGDRATDDSVVNDILRDR